MRTLQTFSSKAFHWYELAAKRGNAERRYWVPIFKWTARHESKPYLERENFPLRMWVVDNSGSMQNTDGHRFVETKRKQDVKVVGCSRWNEIRDCIEYHAQMAAALEAPTNFRMLNDPGCGPNSQQIGIAENSLDAQVLQEDLDRAITIMKSDQPGGVTPLVRTRPAV